MPRTLDVKPVEWRQLCAIAKDMLTQDLTIDDAEWKERIKRRLVGLGFAYPDRPEQLSAAMSAVQRALERQWAPRPMPAPVCQPRPPNSSSGPLTRQEAALMTRVFTELFPSAMKPMSTGRASPSVASERSPEVTDDVVVAH